MARSRKKRAALKRARDKVAVGCPVRASKRAQRGMLALPRENYRGLGQGRLAGLFYAVLGYPKMAGATR